MLTKEMLTEAVELMRKGEDHKIKFVYNVSLLKTLFPEWVDLNKILDKEITGASPKDAVETYFISKTH